MLNWEDLTNYPDKVVYYFKPESSPQYINGSLAFEHTLLPEAGQLKDVYYAYLHVQNIILPEIRKTGLHNITSQMLINWVKAIHGLIGKTLLQIYNVQSGEFNKRITLRWELGSSLSQDFVIYMAGLHESQKTFIEFLYKKYNMDKESAADFIALLNKIASNRKYTIAPCLTAYINHANPAIKGIIVLNKLATAYNHDLLTDEEKNCVKKIVKICMLPIYIPAAMEQWANETINDIKVCDAKDLKKVSEFLASIFYKLREIHPFANANSRTATCLINTFLRAWGYPGIILCDPGEKDHSTGLYQKAFTEIDSSLTALAELIYTRVIEAPEKPYKDEKIKKKVSLLIEFCDLLQETKAKYPQFDLLEFQSESDASPEIAWSEKIEDPTERSMYYLSRMKEKLSQKIEKLAKPRQAILSSLTGLNDTQTIALITSLEIISKEAGWKYAKKACAAWIEIPDLEKANKIIERLRAFELGTLISGRRTDTKVPVIKLEDISYQKLISAAKQISRNNNALICKS